MKDSYHISIESDGNHTDVQMLGHVSKDTVIDATCALAEAVDHELGIPPLEFLKTAYKLNKLLRALTEWPGNYSKVEIDFPDGEYLS